MEVRHFFEQAVGLEVRDVQVFIGQKLRTLLRALKDLVNGDRRGLGKGHKLKLDLHQLRNKPFMEQNRPEADCVVAEAKLSLQL